jgi:quercetin dioxygenase-like cupin family protein
MTPEDGQETGQSPRVVLGTDGERLWFLDALVRVDIPHAAGSDGISVLLFHAPSGTAPPWHVHHTHDEVFHVLEGEVTWRVGEEDAVCRPGDTLLAPKGLPHSYRVTSPIGARWLAITAGADFEGFVRALSRPAERPDLPEPTGPPTAEDLARLRTIAGQNGIEILGSPVAFD